MAMDKALGLDVSSVKLADTFTQTYAQNANKTEGTTVTTKAAGAAG